MEFITTALTSFGAAMTANAISGAEGPARALDDIMTLVGFEKLHLYAEKRRAQTEVEIQAYKEQIAQEIVNIESDKIHDPKISIVGPAIEASKYYIEEEELRSMFAKLIASSMNSDFDNLAHPAFVETLKQMSVLDAKIVKSFGNSLTHTVGKIDQIMDNSAPNIPAGSYFTLMENFYILPDSRYMLDTLSRSTSNLIRLGIISIDPNQSNNLQNEFLKEQRVSDFIKNINVPNTTNIVRTSRMNVTPFGHAFRSCVI